MTKQRDLKGRRVSRAKVLKELGDPSTWVKDAADLARKQNELYEAAHPKQLTSKKGYPVAGYEVVCPDGRVRHYPYHNKGDADCDCGLMNEQQKCSFYPKPGRLERSQPPCPLGEHFVRPMLRH